MFSKQAACLLLLLGAVSCDGGQSDVPNRPLPDKTLVELPSPTASPELSEAARETQAAILTVTNADSLRRFARLADSHPGFASNFQGSDHFRHWSLLRQTGVDPLREIEKLFAEPYAARTVGSDTWYIWPDLAGRTSEELDLELLNFQDKARLLTLVGEEGVSRIRAGSAYPGVRTAISKDGHWVYYVHEIGETNTSLENRE